MLHRYSLTLLFICILFPVFIPGIVFAQSRDNLAPLDARIAALESELQRLTGQIEEQSFKIRSLEQELERKLSDAELRLNDLEKQRTNTAANNTQYPSYEAPAPTQSQEDMPWQVPAQQGSNNTNVLGQITSPPRNALNNSTALYEDAFATLRSGDYNQAEVKFQSFLSSYPNDKLSDNARYWLAETFYVRNQYDEAARGFAQAYQANPQGTKAPDNLLKLGLSLAGLGKTTDACVALDQLLQNYTTGPKAILNRAQHEKSRLACS